MAVSLYEYRCYKETSCKNPENLPDLNNKNTNRPDYYRLFLKMGFTQGCHSVLSKNPRNFAKKSPKFPEKSPKMDKNPRRNLVPKSPKYPRKWTKIPEISLKKSQTTKYPRKIPEKHEISPKKSPTTNY